MADMYNSHLGRTVEYEQGFFKADLTLYIDDNV